MFLKRRLRVLLIVLVGMVILTGAFVAKTYLADYKFRPAGEAITGLDNYTVKTGDSLFTIAGKYGVSIAALKRVNSLNSDTMLTSGQTLTIPDKPAKNWYTVENDDSLYYIALKYNVTVDALQQANRIKNDLIVPGQIMMIPEGGAAFGSNGPAASKPHEKTSSGHSIIDNSPSPRGESIPKKPMTQSLAAIIKEKGINDPWSRIAILVDKSAHTLSLYAGGVWLKSYPVEFGDNGSGDKEVRGDHKTPEGTFYVAEKSVLEPADKFLGTRWLRLSYPNSEDAERGIRQGLITRATYDEITAAIKNKGIPPQYTALGGGVGIHGGNSKEQGSNWTWGCVGLNNHDVEDFFNFVTVGTPVIIQK